MNPKQESRSGMCKIPKRLKPRRVFIMMPNQWKKHTRISRYCHGRPCRKTASTKSWGKWARRGFYELRGYPFQEPIEFLDAMRRV